MAPLLQPTPESVEAARRLSAASGRTHHEVAVVLGSGWSGVVDAVADAGSATRLSTADLPGFHAPTAAGHAGTVTSCLVGGHPTLVVAGRTHLYEGLGIEPVVHPAHVAAAAGCHTLVATNAAGALRPTDRVGDLRVLADHLDLLGTPVLTGPVFVDLVDAWCPVVRAAAREAITEATGAEPAEAVYAAVHGPQYETPAQVRMLGSLGADLVGMSTVPEAVTARALGLRLLGVSLVTNLAAGISGRPLDHSEVLDAGARGADHLAAALRAALPVAARA